MVEFFCSIMCYFLSFIVPRNDSIWIFGAWGGSNFSDNSKYIYIYIQEHQDNYKEVRSIWISKNNSVIRDLKIAGYEAYYYLSIKGLYYQLKAKVIFCTHHHNYDFLGGAVFRKSYICQLWHGTPLKKICLDDEVFYSNYFSRKKKLLRFFCPWFRIDWDMIISPSSSVDATLLTAFDGLVKQCYRVEYPRTSHLIQTRDFSDNIKNAIYMPTFRGLVNQGDDFLTQVGFDIKSLELALSNLNVTLTLKLHPATKISKKVFYEIENSKFINLYSLSDDVYSELMNFDVLITDYSSIMFDFLLLNKPIIFTPFDIDEYISCSRGLYYNYDSINLTPKVTSWIEVINFIDEFNQGDNEDYYKRYNKIKNQFHSPSRNSISLILDEIMKAIRGAE